MTKVMYEQKHPVKLLHLYRQWHVRFSICFLFHGVPLSGCPASELRRSISGWDGSICVLSHVQREQRDEATGVLGLQGSSAAGDGAIQPDLGEGWGVSPRVPVLRLGAHQFSEALPEACGEQAVDDGIDCWAEVEEEAGHDVDVLVNAVHQIRPVADGTPQEPFYVEGRPAEPEDGDHDG